MQILSQNREVMVNMDRIHSVSVYGFLQSTKDKQKKYRILAWYGNGEDDCWGIGDYATEERAKEIVREIWMKYGEYLHRQGGSAILAGTSDIPEAFFVLPKLYEMPEE